MKKAILFLFMASVVGCSPEGDMETSPTQAVNNLHPPTISSVTPSDNSSNVSQSPSIVVVFSKTMNTSSISVNSSNTTCTDAIQISSDNFSTCMKWEGNPNASSNNTTFTGSLTDNLTSKGSYKIKIKKTVRDKDDVYLLEEWLQSSGFEVMDWVASSVSSTIPSDNATSIAQTDSISITFSEAMDNSTISVNSDNTSCAGSVRLSSDNFSNCVRFADNRSTSDNTTFIFYPNDNLTSEATYKLKVTTDAKGADNLSISAEYTQSNGFTVIDWIKPTLVFVTPADSASSINNKTNITIQFSEVMLASSLSITTSGTTCSGTLQVSKDDFNNCIAFNDNRSSIDNITFVFDPVDNLTSSSTYKIKVTTGAKDEANNAMSADNVTSNGFTTN